MPICTRCKEVIKKSQIAQRDGSLVICNYCDTDERKVLKQGIIDGWHVTHVDDIHFLIRPDGVSIYKPAGHSTFRVHRPNTIGYGFEDFTGPKGTARSFKTVEAAKIAVEKEWPLTHPESLTT